MKKFSLFLALVILSSSGHSVWADDSTFFYLPPTKGTPYCKFSADTGRNPAADNCDTARELMSLNVQAGQFKGICQQVVNNDPLCKNVDTSKRLDCSSRASNVIGNSRKLEQKIAQCALGATVDAAWSLVKFVGDMISFLYKEATLNNATKIARFLADPAYRLQVMAPAGQAVVKGAKAAPAAARKAANLGDAFIKNLVQYAGRELPKNTLKHGPVEGLAKTIAAPLFDLLSKSVESIVRFFNPEYDCMNGVAKLNTICRTAGEFFMPPTAVFLFMKYGAKGLKAWATKSPKVQRLRKNFISLNAAAKKKVLGKARPKKASTKPAVVVRAERAKRPVDEMSDNELVQLARTERAEARKIAGDKNEKTLSEVEAILRGETQATKALTTSADTSVLSSITLPHVDSADMVKMMLKPQYDSILLKVDGNKRMGTATALKVLESGAGQKEAVQTYLRYEKTFKMIRTRAPATDRTSEAYLATFIVKQKKAGVPDDAIKKKIDEAFNSCQ